MHVSRIVLPAIQMIRTHGSISRSEIAEKTGVLLLPEIDRVVQDRAVIRGENQVQILIPKLQEKDWAVGATFLIAEKTLVQRVLKSVEKKR